MKQPRTYRRCSNATSKTRRSSRDRSSSGTGGTVVVQDRPERSPSLENYPECDREVRRLTEKLWGNCDGTDQTRNRVGRGQLVWMTPWSEKEDPETTFIRTHRPRDPFFARAAHTVVWSEPLRTLLDELHVVPDVEVRAVRGQPLTGTAMAWGGRKLVPCGTREGEDVIAWTHRRSDEGDIYFVANQTAASVEAELVFRVHGRQPEIWDPMTGDVQAAGTWNEEANRTVVPLFFSPFDSKFIVLRASGRPSGEKGVHQTNLFDPTRDVSHPITIQGDWEVTFPREDVARVKIETPLVSWTGGPRPVPQRKTFTTWKFYTKETPLLPSGLLGPVRLVTVGVAPDE